MRRLALAALSLAFLATACQPAITELTEEQKAEIAAEVSAINAVYWDAWRAADFDRGMSYFHNSPETVWGYAGNLDMGWDAIYAAYSPLFGAIASQAVTITESRTTVVARDVVCINEVGSTVPTDTAGVAGPEMNFALLTVWVRRGGEWKVLFGHESTPVPESM
jgi:ketosteroid isomerase-like protein